jgi:hypothetical protein
MNYDSPLDYADSPDDTASDIDLQVEVAHDENDFVVGDKKVDAGDVLERLSKLFRKKNTGYGDTYLTQGAIMTALFPDGVTLSTDQDFNRFYIVDEMVMKFQRYCRKFAEGGHLDSLHDTIVYGAMLAELDENIKFRDKDLVSPERLTEDEMAAGYTVADGDGSGSTEAKAVKHTPRVQGSGSFGKRKSLLVDPDTPVFLGTTLP